MTPGLMVGLLAGALPASAMEPDTSPKQSSEDGLYVVGIANRPEPVPLNELHTWALHLETADGTAVSDAAIGVSGGMPKHDHGLPTAPRISAAPGDGNYLLEGVRFQMPGHWVVELEIVAGPGTDTVTFELML